MYRAEDDCFLIMSSQNTGNSILNKCKGPVKSRRSWVLRRYGDRIDLRFSPLGLYLLCDACGRMTMVDFCEAICKMFTWFFLFTWSWTTLPTLCMLPRLGIWKLQWNGSNGGHFLAPACHLYLRLHSHHVPDWRLHRKDQGDWGLMQWRQIALSHSQLMWLSGWSHIPISTTSLTSPIPHL